MIRLEQVSRTFAGAGGAPVHAVRDLSLEIVAGETLALVGPSGCGKTTTLRLINRLIEPTSGRITIGDEETSTLDPVRLRRRMGYVVQSGGLFPHLTVGRNIGLLCELEGWPRARVLARVDELLSLVHLAPDEFRSRFPRELSGGQRQRVGVARALALDPEILLMDEPFGALDPLTRASLQQEFVELERLVAKTIVIVSHDLAEAFLLGDRLAVLNAGRLVQVGTPEDVRTHPSTEWVATFVAGVAGAAGAGASAGAPMERQP
jgi:osmoprotectant transport system ATP-binding protein